MNAKETQQKKQWSRILKWLCIALIVYSVLSLLGDFAAWMLYRTGGLSFSIPPAVTIGIIGGADGPTAIFVTSSAAPVWKVALNFILLLLGIVGFRFVGRKQKGEE